jgi:hypothetical protein
MARILKVSFTQAVQFSFLEWNPRGVMGDPWAGKASALRKQYIVLPFHSLIQIASD